MNNNRPNPGEKGRPKVQKGILKRTIKLLFQFYPVLAPLTVFCMLFSSVVSAIPSIFMQNILAIIEKWYVSRD